MKKWVVGVTAILLSACSTQSSLAEQEDTYACRVIDFYDYENPAPYSDAIEETYYKDTLFAGDSRMGSLSLYGSHEDAEVAYVTSLNLLLIDTMPLDEQEDGRTLTDVFHETSKNNIYLLFGINEIRNPSFDLFAEKLDEIVKELKQRNPMVQIYIILAYHPDYISKLPEPLLSQQLMKLNEHLITVARENHVYYLNLDNGMSDEEHTIKDEYVADGLHFTWKGAQAFEEYIATHVVRREDYVQEICQ